MEFLNIKNKLFFKELDFILKKKSHNSATKVDNEVNKIIQQVKSHGDKLIPHLSEEASYEEKIREISINQSKKGKNKETLKNKDKIKRSKSKKKIKTLWVRRKKKS